MLYTMPLPYVIFFMEDSNKGGPDTSENKVRDKGLFLISAPLFTNKMTKHPGFSGWS